MADGFEMEDDERSEIIEEFLSEADQYLQDLNDCLLKAEELIKDGQTVDKDDVNKMFRAAHTIKGTASFLALKVLTNLTHEMETILDRIRNDELVFTAQIIDVLFSAFDSLNALLVKLKEEGSDDADVSEALAKIAKVLSGESLGEDVSGSDKETVDVVAVEEDVKDSVQQDADTADFEKYLPVFIEDAEQNIERFNEILLAIEQGDMNTDFLDELFRVSHTIKGSSGIINRKDIEQVAHKMEDILSQLREKKELPSENITSLLFKGIDWIKEVVVDLIDGKTASHDSTELLVELKSVLENKETVDQTKTEQSVSDSTVTPIDIQKLSQEEKTNVKNLQDLKHEFYLITIAIVATSTSKIMKAFVVREHLGKMGVIIKVSPDDTQIEDSGDQKVLIQYLFASKEDEQGINSTLTLDEVEMISMKKEEMPKEEVVPLETAVATKSEEKKKTPDKKESVTKTVTTGSTTMRIDTRKLDTLMNLAGELVITRARFSQLVNELSEEIDKTKDISSKFQIFESAFSKYKTGNRKQASNDQGNMGDEDLTHQLNDIKKNLSMKEIVTKVYNLDEATNVLEKLSSDIQNGVMQTRMVQIEGVFSKFKRLVRDIGKSVQKDVVLKLYGEETELDKKITDELGDPLTHMIRNAVDHGLENREERAASGKDTVGVVTLGASHMGNNICIEISDDGHGLDCEKLAQKSFEKGIITEEDMGTMSEKDKLNLIFAPGFSTAEKVTGLSGRGVGMDVVKRMIESLNGTVDIETELGKGTSFKLKIPLTLAIIQALLVVIDGQVFAIPLEAVSEIIKIITEEIYSVEGNSTIKLRGHALSLIELEHVIKLKKRKVDQGNCQRVVVISDGEQLLGVTVDQLIGEEEIVIKSLPMHFSNVSGISGASILGDGGVALILDVLAIVQGAQGVVVQ